MADKIAAKASGGRPAIGSILWSDPETKRQPIGVRITKADGKRKIVRFDHGTTREEAIELAPVLADRARLAVDEATGDTVARVRRAMACGPQGPRHRVGAVP